ncbi:TPA: hypothetical protein NEG48_003169 [Elizabethkingia anophelis]|nr:hypothetical protein [Elizabethkingia anophelis]
MKKIDTKIYATLAFAPAILFLTSCRSTDTDQTLSGGAAAIVKINLQGTDYADSKTVQPLASATSKTAGLVDGDIQSHSTLLNPSSVIVAQLIPAGRSGKLSPKATSGITPVAEVPGNPLTKDTKYRVIAYRSSDGVYQTHQDYTIGQSGQPLALLTGTAYNIIAYSYGSGTLPPISTLEQTNMNTAVLNYDNNNRDFMYQNTSFNPTAPNNILNITLRHKSTQILTVLASDEKISSVSNVVITPHFSDGTIALTSGSISGRTTAASTTVSFAGPFPAVKQTADPVFVNADTQGAALGSLSADVTIRGVSKTITLPNAFKITPETNSILNINLYFCGAFVAPGVWKNFMCHNLGADTSANPFTPSATIHGAKYQWGAQTDEAGRYVSQADDLANSGSIANWNTTILPAGTWSETSKTPQDPCPSGYKVPTIAELEGLMLNNTVTRIGSWTDNFTNYSSGVQFGNSLFLPAAGRRSSNTGGFFGRGLQANYWGSTERAQITIRETSYNVYTGQIGYLGFSIRCIKE